MEGVAASREAFVFGALRGHRPGVPFRGRVVLDRRDDCVYYTWRLEAADGEFLSSVGRPVSLRVIPPGQDPFAFALAHAVEGIRRYRLGRQRPFEVTGWEWSRAEPAAAADGGRVPGS